MNAIFKGPCLAGCFCVESCTRFWRWHGGMSKNNEELRGDRNAVDLVSGSIAAVSYLGRVSSTHPLLVEIFGSCQLAGTGTADGSFGKNVLLLTCTQVYVAKMMLEVAFFGYTRRENFRLRCRGDVVTCAKPELKGKLSPRPCKTFLLPRCVHIWGSSVLLPALIDASVTKIFGHSVTKTKKLRSHKHTHTHSTRYIYSLIQNDEGSGCEDQKGPRHSSLWWKGTFFNDELELVELGAGGGFLVERGMLPKYTPWSAFPRSFLSSIISPCTTRLPAHAFVLNKVFFFFFTKRHHNHEFFQKLVVVYDRTGAQLPVIFVNSTRKRKEYSHSRFWKSHRAPQRIFIHQRWSDWSFSRVGRLLTTSQRSFF